MKRLLVHAPAVRLWKPGIEPRPGELYVSIGERGRGIDLYVVDPPHGDRHSSAPFLLNLYPNGITRNSSVNPVFGLPLDANGRILMRGGGR